MEHKLKGIFFDWDLTLVDSFSGRDAFVDVLNRTFNITLEKQVLQVIFAMSLHHAIEYLYDVLKPDLSHDAFFQKVKALTYEVNRDFTLRDEHILHELKKNHVLAIISNNEQENITPVLSHYPKIFEGIWAGPDDKRIKLRKALDAFSLHEHEVIYVGDHPSDIEASRDLNMSAIAIESPLFTREELLQFNPDFVIQNLSELLEYVREWEPVKVKKHV